tara:strand:- start:8571 stop:9671 length:1101 start_codon:yes stop_codon:yes gene_type:complete
LTYYDLTVEVDDLNSIEKISDAIDDVISGGESDSTAHLVLGKLGHYKNPHSDLDYLEMEGPDVDISNWTSENKGRLVENPKKGEVVFLFYYYYDHADYVLTKNENFNNICFEFKSFKDEAVLTRQDYSGVELTANDASGGGELRLEIIFSNGQSFQGTPEGKDELIKELHNFLSETEDREIQEEDIVKKKNGSAVFFPYGDFTLEDEFYDEVPEYRNLVNVAIKNFVDDFKEKAEVFFGEKILIGEKILVSDGKDLHELEEWTNVIQNSEMLGGIYIFLINEISADDLNGLFLSMDDYGFYAIFPSNGELINQGYYEGEYNTGYFNMDNEEAYTYAYIDDDGSYNPKEGRETIVMQYNEAVKNFTK